MSSIDLIVLGMVMERPQSAYELQKDVQAHHFSRWTRVSVPSVYKKVLQLRAAGYLESGTAAGKRPGGRTVYTVTEKGRRYFAQLMEECASRQISFLLDLNVMVTNLNKLEKDEGLKLLARLRQSLTASAGENRQYAREFKDIPLVGRTVFEQQDALYAALESWLDDFERRFAAE
ncbi:PadR family transcriptional regulator [Anaerofilum sp. BX8]|uniref:PadR family transcriptional regulator n=1 Tax=Anaerofilum hominis TaxID=2763016 RepID=A0A923I781_9FIRM|nr:PadR family transcriptional regulator [Anaerofilum hominis]MBC5580242.1 PadR family transcriptional regulator [Anaerofilum hominis]